MSAVRLVLGEAVCPTHGAYNYRAYRKGALTLGQVCPHCMNDQLAKNAAHSQRISARLADQQLQQRKEGAGIPQAFMRASLANYRVTTLAARENLTTMRDYVDNFDVVLQTTPATGLILSGASGNGKTHLGCAVVSALLERGRTAAYESLPALLARLRETMSAARGSLNASGILEPLSQVQLLVLDEFGAHTRNDADYQNLFRLIDARHQANMPTVMITNLTVEVFKSEVGPRLLERIQGRQGPELVFSGPSWRQGPLRMAGEGA